MQQTFLFYDLETSGVNKCFDQIFQFAAIRTDLELNELERHEILIKLNPDTIPDPSASITHHLGIDYLNDNGVCEYEAVKQIHQLMNEPGTISIGYNTMGFDDEFLRFSFHRNLLTPYTHQFANQCWRADIYPMMPVYYLFVTDALKWPQVDGKVSFKLENLNAQNQFVTEGRAHDAMVDIEVTIALARVLKQHQKVWQYLLGCFNKRTDQMRFESFKGNLTVDEVEYPQAIMVNGIFGMDDAFHIPVLYLGQHYSYKNQACFLRLDDPDMQTTDIEVTPLWRLIIRKKWGEPPILLPANKHYAQHLNKQRLQCINDNKQWLTKHVNYFQSLKETALSYKYPEYESVDPDADLYKQGFPDDNLLKTIEHFHQQDYHNKVKTMHLLPEQLQQRARRLLARNSIECLPESDKLAFQAYLESVASFDTEELPIDFKGQPRRCLADVFDDIQQLKETGLSDEQAQLLEELEAYIS